MEIPEKCLKSVIDVVLVPLLLTLNRLFTLLWRFHVDIEHVNAG